jgi:hypothetical protein
LPVPHRPGPLSGGPWRADRLELPRQTAWKGAGISSVIARCNAEGRSRNSRHRDPQPQPLTIATHGSSRYRPRPFPFHPDVSRPAARPVKQRGDFSGSDRGGECAATRKTLTRQLALHACILFSGLLV